MMTRTSAVFVLLIACPAAVPAQAARMGRLAVLAPLASGATCSGTVVSGELRDAGIERLLSITEPNHPRLLSLAVSARGVPRMLMVMMSTHERRRGEGESVTIHFDGAGAIVRGARSAYTTGTPARLSEDHQSGLFPADTGQARDMARALLRLCRA